MGGGSVCACNFLADCHHPGARNECTPPGAQLAAWLQHCARGAGGADWWCERLCGAQCATTCVELRERQP